MVLLLALLVSALVSNELALALILVLLYGGPQVPTSRKPTTVVLCVFWTLALLGHRSLRCVVGTSTTQQFRFVVLPKNPQHNNLQLLFCGFSGRWHLWATLLLQLVLTTSLDVAVVYLWSLTDESR